MLKRIVLTFLFGFSTLAADFYQETGVEVFVLENGMRVALKQTENEPGEVLVRLMAEGGFAELPARHRAAGEISLKAALRSGISDFGFDKMHTLLYEYSIEFETQMQPFSRSLELSSGSNELEQLFKFVNLFFTKSRFSQKAYEAHKKNLQVLLKNREFDSIQKFEDAFMDLNTQQFHVFNSLKAKDVEKASFEQSQHFFNQSFVNPADFVCVVVGDFSSEKAKQLIINYLGEIPKKDGATSPKIPRLPNFQKGIKTKVMKNSQKSHAITRMTFPLQLAVKQDNARCLEVVNSLIKERLESKLCQQEDLKAEIRVCLDFPYYPSFHCPWITIQYISDQKFVSSIGQSILVELKRMQIDGFTKEEIEKIRIASEASEKLAQMENFYWLTQIANYMIWNWDLAKLKKDFQDASCWNLGEANKNMSSAISMDHYSIISLQP